MLRKGVRLRIKLLVDLPIGPEHRMKRGQVLEMTEYVVRSDAGIGIGLLPHEFMLERNVENTGGTSS